MGTLFNVDRIVKGIENIYQEPYSPNIPYQLANTFEDLGSVPEVTSEEVLLALKSMKRGKTPGANGLLIYVLKDAGTIVIAD